MTSNHMDKLIEQNTQILVRLSAIDERLKSINGEVQDTKSFKHGCPERMKELSGEITKVKLQQTRNTIYIGVGVAIIAALAQLAVRFIH